MTKILRQAVVNSERKGYHVTRIPVEQLREFRKQRDPHFAMHYGPDPFFKTSAIVQTPEQSAPTPTTNGAEHAAPAVPAPEASKPVAVNGKATNPVKVLVIVF